MVKLRDQVGHTVFLSIWAAEGPTLVRWLDGSQLLSVSVKPGQRVSLLDSTSGRLFLGFEKWDRLQPFVANALRQRRSEGKKSLLTLEDVKALRAEVAANGMSRVLGEVFSGVHGLSAPIFNSSGELAMAISTVGLEQHFDANYHGPIAEHLRRISAAASAELGYAPRQIVR
jgi:DNA-binding IclR family transcriptional regulator